MGKESLIKSTSKKAAPKKAKTTKKTASKSGSGAKTAKKASPKAKTTKSGKAEAASTTKAPKAPTIQDLLFKKFADHPTPKEGAAASPDFSKMTAPPFIDTDDPKEAERLRSLLSLKFSMAEIKTVAKPPEEPKPAPGPPKAEEPKPVAPAPEPPKAEPPTLGELLFKKFTEYPTPKEGAAASPDFSKMTAPPFIDTDDPKEAERLRSLLSLKFSMAEIKAVAEPPEEPKPAPGPPKAEEPKPAAPKAEEPKPAAPAPEPPKVETPKPVASKPVASKPEVKPQASKPAPVAAAPQPSTSPAPQEEPEERFTDPVLRSAVIGLSVTAVLFLIILWASFNNSTKYFIVPKKGSIEIWRGEFSPTGKEFFAVLHGVEPELPIEEEYSREAVYPMIFDYYLEKSDALLEVSELPDYKSIIDYLEKAETFALNTQMKEAVANRLNNIQRLTLLYKADVDAGKGTVESMAAAIENLKQTQRLTKDPAQAEVIKQKIESLMERKTALEKEIEAGAAPVAAPEEQENTEHEE